MNKSLTFILGFLGCIVYGSNGQSIGKFNPSAQLPVDTTLKIGELENGFRYYIKKSTDHTQTIQLRLIVKVGTKHEPADKKEIAHLIEHLAFEGTANFPLDSIIRYTSKKGMLFGDQITAFTAPSKTGYILNIPNSDLSLLANSLLILRDWAQNMTFDSARIRAQIGAVIEEGRFSQNGLNPVAMSIEGGKKFKSEFDDTEFNNVEANLRKIDRKSVLQFYHDWYRPELEAVIIIGDVDTKKMEENIVATFSDLRAYERRRGTGKYNISNLTDSDSDNFMCATKSTITSISLDLFYKRKFIMNQMKTHGDYRTFVNDELLNVLLGNRFRNIPRRYNIPSVNSWIVKNAYESGWDFFTLRAALDDSSQMEEAFKQGLAELERLRRFGFSAGELRVARESLLKDFASADFTSIRYQVGRCIDHFVTGKFVSDVTYARNLVQELVDKLTLQEINNSLKSWLQTRSMPDIIVIGPSEGKEHLPRQSDFLQWGKEVRRISDIASMDTVSHDQISLIDTEVINTFSDDLMFSEKCLYDSIKTLELSNGVKVLLFPPRRLVADGQSKMIMLNGFSYGGSKLYEGKQKIVCDNAVSVVRHCGVGDFDKFQLEDFLKTKNVYVSPFIGDSLESIIGKSSINDVEIMLQAVYLYFTSPRKDDNAFKDWRMTKKSELRSMYFSSGNFFGTVVNNLTHHQSTFSPDDVESISLADALRIYGQRFSGVSDFVFSVSGEYIYDERLRDLIIRYLGNIPRGTKDRIRSGYNPFDCSRMDTVIYHGRQKMAEAYMYFTSTCAIEDDINNIHALEIVTESFRRSVIDRLRTKEGGVFNPMVYFNHEKMSDDSIVFRIGVHFYCELGNEQNMIRGVIDEFQMLVENGINQNSLDTSVSLVGSQSRLYNDDYSKEVMAIALGNRLDTQSLGKDRILKNVEVEGVRALIRSSLGVNNRQIFILLPSETMN
ncbi:M16 family metallopeptidase [Dawidia soli]|uniref:Insulinase family protein n=1 Tax=Dawidia soli TaxID=2782352 RepID=A0AAP2D7W9_9BACT|nr:insulinase family protein [Dawidia soli]MBT1687108.1 insulinase family protein [Dawidia soli]